MARCTEPLKLSRSGIMKDSCHADGPPPTAADSDGRLFHNMVYIYSEKKLMCTNLGTAKSNWGEGMGVVALVLGFLNNKTWGHYIIYKFRRTTLSIYLLGRHRRRRIFTRGWTVLLKTNVY